MRVPYAGPMYGEFEIAAALKVLRNPKRLAANRNVARFEGRMAARFGMGHAVMVNSGSSANLLALSAFGYEPGDGVLTPALTFGTTVAPILQLGLTPQYVDSDPNTYQVDLASLFAARTDETRAVMVPLLLGNVPDLNAIAGFCERHGLDLIVDSCDTLDAEWRGAPVGAYADAVTTSFYASHIITAAGGGGMVAFHDPDKAAHARLLAYWGRASNLGDDVKPEARYRDGYDTKFRFTAPGYNMQPLEMQAAFALAQLYTLESRKKVRARHWQRLFDFFGRWGDAFVRPSVLPGALPHWLAFPIRVRDGVSFTRKDLALHLEALGIETRPIMAGNILRQPGFRGDADGFPGADTATDGGLLLGCHQGLTDAQLAHVEASVGAFMAERGREAA